MSRVGDRIRNLEDNFTERKLEGANSRDLRRTIVAFANSALEDHPGILYLGMADNGKVQGVTDPDALQKKIRRLCEHDCYPPIKTTSEVIPVEGKQVLAIVVPSSLKRPHFSGPAYIRIGSESLNASEELYEELITSRHSIAGALQAIQYETVTVTVIDKMLGNPQRLISSHTERHDCLIEEVTAHYVRLKNIKTGEYVTESLEGVSISYDDKRSKPMLVIRQIG